MPIALGTNIASLNAQRRLAESTSRLSAVSERLSSGQRINRAADDAAGLAVSSALNARTRIYTQAVRNVNDGVSALTIADQALGTLSEIVTRQRELAAQSANGVYTTVQRQALDTEAQALGQEYNRVAQTTAFNGVNLLSGAAPSLLLQAGIGNGAILKTQILNQNTSLTNVTSDAGTTTNTTQNLDPVESSSQYFAGGFLVGDLNNDGISDLVALGMYNSDLPSTNWFNMAVYLGNASGDFSSPAAQASVSKVSIGHASNGGSMQATLNDYDGDGDLDIRLSASFNFDTGGATQNENELFTNSTVQNGGTFSISTAFNDNIPAAANNITSGGSSIADFNGDGMNDDAVLNGDGTYTIRIHNTTTAAVSVTTTQSVAESGFNLLSQSSARSAMDSLSTVADTLGNVRGNIGAALSRAASATNVLSVTSTNYSAAESRIMAADISYESAELVRNSILQKAGAAVLAQANQQPQIALRLLNA